MMTKLNEIINKTFSAEDLQVFAKELYIDYENLSGSTKTLKALSLQDHVRRRGQTDKLLNELYRAAPHLQPELKMNLYLIIVDIFPTELAMINFLEQFGYKPHMLGGPEMFAIGSPPWSEQKARALQEEMEKQGRIDDLLEAIQEGARQRNLVVDLTFYTRQPAPPQAQGEQSIDKTIPQPQIQRSFPSRQNKTITFDDFILQTKTLLAQRNFKEAFNYIDTLLAPYLQINNPDLYYEFIGHKESYDKLKRDRRRKLITQEQAETGEAILVQHLYEYLADIPRPAQTERSSVIIAEAAIAPNAKEFEQVINVNSFQDVNWMQKGLQAANSVCRILAADGSYYGTGFMIAPRLLMTNSHVIPNKAVAAKSKAEFNYQIDVDGNAMQAIRYQLDPERQFHHSPADELDYTIVSLMEEAGKPSLDEWGYLDINPHADPVPSERVFIIQHPNGGRKQIVMWANEVVRIWGKYRLQYTADTMQGSSGAPVFNNQWQVVAIHHAGGELPVNEQGQRREINEGILMSAIKKDAGEHWPQHNNEYQ